MKTLVTAITISLSSTLVSMDFSSMKGQQAECLAKLSKTCADLAASNPKASAVAVGLGGASYCLYKGWDYVKNMDAEKVRSRMMLGYDAINILVDLKKKLYDAAEAVEEEENRLRVEQAASESSFSSSSSSSSSYWGSSPNAAIFIPHAVAPKESNYSPPLNEKMSIFYEIRGNNAHAHLIFLNCRKPATNNNS